ncbi:FGGY family carbohydrate kinase [Corynebacterium suedekumii]|nr:FGGY family carbohydrate kinase [Corynebacterium suedekumii]
MYTADGVQVGKAYALHTIDYLGPGRAEMDVEHLVTAAFAAIADALDDAVAAGIHRSEVAGIALSGILVGQVLLDEDGQILHPVITSLDTRAEGHAAAAARDLEPLWLTESGTSTLDAYAAPLPAAVDPRPPPRGVRPRRPQRLRGALCLRAAGRPDPAGDGHRPHPRLRVDGRLGLRHR